MKAKATQLVITLEEDEVWTFLNIVSFALDFQEERDKQNEPCMTESELKLAKELEDLVKKLV